MPHLPRISVLIPSHNLSPYLPRAIESVLAQDLDDWELLVIDDASSDDSLEVAEGFAARDPRIRVVRNEQNLGLAGTLNRGFRAARGALVCVLDADDWLTAESLSTRAAVLDDPAVDAVHAALVCCDDDGAVTRRYAPLDHGDTDSLVAFLAGGAPGAAPRADGVGVNTITLMWRHELLDRLGARNPMWSPHDDYEFGLRMLAGARVAVLDTVVYCYRTRAGSMAATAAASTAAAELSQRLEAHYRRRAEEGGMSPPSLDGLLVGTASAAYQIEGAVDVDGRSESVWDRFCDEPGRIRDGATGAVACDHYHRFREDVALMRDLNLGAYNFSVAWPRVIPGGTGAVESRGIAFYDRLVDACLEAGVEPWITLYHWDLPQVLQDRGGWLERDTASAFVDYAAAVAEAVGDRVRHWITVNEPDTHAYNGYGEGFHAPGLQTDALCALHHQLLAHGMAMPVLRELLGADAVVGPSFSLTPVYPATDSDADVAAAKLGDVRTNGWQCEPLFHGRYPDDPGQAHPKALRDGDLEVISRPIDMLGVSVYSRSVVKAGPDGQPVPAPPKTAMETVLGWEVYPESIGDILTQVHERYAPRALMIAGNGSAFNEQVAEDGVIDDVARQQYLREHLRSVAAARQRGVPVVAYMAWTLLDNFEWAEGFNPRFGVVAVEDGTLRRVPKRSAAWLQQLGAGIRRGDGRL